MPGMQKVSNEQQAPPPPILYRFLGEKGLDTLVNGNLKVTQPRLFNDPFELCPALPDVESIKDDKWREHFLAPNGFAKDSILRERKATAAGYPAYVKDVMLKRTDLWPQHLQSLRSAFITAASRFFGIACFSDFGDPTQQNSPISSSIGIRHWSHYASDHKGIAIAFNTSHPAFQMMLTRRSLFKVAYHDPRPPFALADFNDRSNEHVIKVLRKWASIKSNIWGNEREWRVIVPLSSTHCSVRDGHLMYSSQLWSPKRKPESDPLVKQVYLGANATAEFQMAVLDALTLPYYEGIEIYKATLHDTAWQLEYERLR